MSAAVGVGQTRDLEFSTNDLGVWSLQLRLREEVQARPMILITALMLDALVLGALVYTKGVSDPVVLMVCAAGFVLIFGSEWLFLRQHEPEHDA